MLQNLDEPTNDETEEVFYTTTDKQELKLLELNEESTGEDEDDLNTNLCTDITQNGDICNSNNIPLAEQSKQEVLLDMALWSKSIIEKNSKFVNESISETVPNEIFDTNSFNESVLNNDGSANDFPPNLNKPKQMWPTKAALKQYKAAERPQKQYHQYDDEKFENRML